MLLALAVLVASIVVSSAVIGEQHEQAADPSVIRVAPKTPDEAMRTFEVDPGFSIELVAAEPLVRDPIAMDFDEDGNAYVIELRTYNQYASNRPPVTASIRRLVDTDGDGLFDRSDIFADDLRYPTGLLCVNGGVLVGDAPDLVFLRDTDDDGKADHREVWFTGFGSDPAGEGELNSFRWGVDNRIHISTGLSGGEVRPADRPDAPAVSVRNRRFVLDARTREFELTSGGGQHGMSIDQWGQVFVCDNSEPVMALMYDDRYLERNPAVAAPPAAIAVVPDGKYTRLHRISQPEPWRVIRTRLRSNDKFQGYDERGLVGGFFTAAAGVTVYSGDAWPQEFLGSVFVGESANNLVYRATLNTEGLRIVGQRADTGREFLASRDTWFRPVQFANAPDGNLYVIDMYRGLVEGATYLPPHVLAELGATAGNRKGRIYRITPKDFQRRSRVRLSSLSTCELVDLLEHSNGWHRTTASRLLYERNDRKAVHPLRRLLFSSESPFGRLHAAYVLASLRLMEVSDVMRVLADEHPRVRENAVRLAEQFAAQSPEVQNAVASLADDDDIRVRYQVAFSATYLPQDMRDLVLIKLARDHADEPWMRLAVRSSLNSRAAGLFGRLLCNANFRSSPSGAVFLNELAQQVFQSNERDEHQELVSSLAALLQATSADNHFVRELIKGLLRRGTTAKVALAFETAPAPLNELLSDIVAEAHAIALDSSEKAETRATAVVLLSIAPLDSQTSVFEDLLAPAQPMLVQSSVVSVLSRFDDVGVAELMLSKWNQLMPQIRSETLELLLSRRSWMEEFFRAIESERIDQRGIDRNRIAILETHPDASIRTRAASLFVSTAARSRAEIVKRYEPSLRLKGDASRGRNVFRKQCSACHELEGIGTNIGPSLQSISSRGRESVLLSILDPNRQINPEYLSYSLITADGRVIVGVIKDETANGLRVHQLDGTTVDLARSDVDEVTSTGLSYMPEGLEAEISVESMADLLSYLDSIR